MDETLELIEGELKEYGLSGAPYELIRAQRGIAAARVFTEAGPLILKAFSDEPSRREIENYRILNSIGVPTLRLEGATEKSLLMEDITASETIRLGRESDLHDKAVIKAIGRWYRLLHERGREYVLLHGAGMYDEWDLFTRENIEMLTGSLGGECEKPLRGFIERFDDIRDQLDSAPKTLCYNDFYYTNMAVARDKSYAFMFDYDLLGKGCAVSDHKNATYWFDEEETEAFNSGYGGVDNDSKELFELIEPVITLISAVKRGIFPDWAEDARLRLIENN